MRIVDSIKVKVEDWEKRSISRIPFNKEMFDRLTKLENGRLEKKYF